MLDFFGLFKVDILYVILGLFVIVIALMIICIVNSVKYTKLRKRYEVFMTGKDAESLEQVMIKYIDDIDSLKKVGKNHTAQIKKINEALQTTYCKIGIVKYDAFNEMGGKLSFALCMLDKTDNGYIINVMHSKDGCYSYVKEIIHGESYITLGDEEKKALDTAIKYNSDVEE